VKRGEVWIAAAGHGYAGKPRPVVIVQDHRIETASITVCGFTTDSTDVPTVRPTIHADDQNGLNFSSMVMTDKIMTVPRDKLGRRIGTLGDADMARLNDAILVFLGLSA
jgi:mRNA interferase MazF